MRGYLPRIDDFFPSTRRGHGTTHPMAKFKNGVQTRAAVPCVNPACERLRRQGGEGHLDKEANINDWKADRGIHSEMPLEECFR